MATNGKRLWLDQGYTSFAYGGRAALRVEVLSQQVGISKSSFYHHFADLEMFTEQLLSLHLERAQVLAEKERQAMSIDPELIRILVDHKTDLLFSRQLRMVREEPAFARTVSQTQQAIGNDFVKLWARELGWKGSMAQLEVLFTLVLENFFLQLTPEHLEVNWLRQYFLTLAQMVRVFQS